MNYLFENFKLGIASLIVAITLTVLKFIYTPVWFYSLFEESSIGNVVFAILFVGSIGLVIKDVFIYFFGDPEIHGDKVRR